VCVCVLCVFLYDKNFVWFCFGGCCVDVCEGGLQIGTTYVVVSKYWHNLGK